MVDRCAVIGRFFLPAVWGMGLLVAAEGCHPGGEARSAPGKSAPNVFLIVLDAASAGHFGCYGNKHGTSPNIDRLAAESVVFENAYSQTATTVTSTASLLTGVRATTHLMTTRTKLPTHLSTMAELLSQDGMTTYGFIGNPFAGAPATGLDRGYHQCIEVYALPSLQGRRKTEASSHFKVTYPEDVNHEIFQRLGKFGKSGTFAYIHYLQPHKPYDPPQAYRHGLDCGQMSWDDLHVLFEMSNREKRASMSTIRHIRSRYHANIRYVDAGVGELIERLKGKGLYDESLIILMSDHGDAFFKHRWFGHNTTLYDDMTHIPLLIKFPKSEGIHPRRIKNLAETIDIAPTLFDYLGLATTDQWEGDSLWPLISGQQSELPHPEVINCTIQRNKHAIRVLDYKYIFSLSGHEELYNLHTDPDERHNLMRAEHDKGEALRRKLESIVDIASGKTLPRNSTLRSDPRMDELLKSLGYTGDTISDTAPPPSEISTQPTTTQVSD